MRAIALFEVTKGLLVLTAGFSLLALLDRDVQAWATRLIDLLHLNPSRKYAETFVDAASRVTNRDLWSLAVLAVIYAAFRLLEGYGLWRERTWAEWLALVSGMTYLPFEIYELVDKATWAHAAVLAVNLLIVIAVALLLYRTRRLRSEKFKL